MTSEFMCVGARHFRFPSPLGEEGGERGAPLPPHPPSLRSGTLAPEGRGKKRSRQLPRLTLYTA